jgi:hypothetical protein
LREPEPRSCPPGRIIIIKCCMIASSSVFDQTVPLVRRPITHLSLAEAGFLSRDPFLR